jgi:hypothetical protein
MEHACDPCGTRWTPPTPSALKAIGGSALLALASFSALGMLWFLHSNDTTLGGGLGIGALAAMGLGVKLRGAGLPRCPECGRLGYASDPEASSDSLSE